MVSKLPYSKNKKINKKQKKQVYKKQYIPKAVKRIIWEYYNGQEFYKAKCNVKWCKNIITPFDFHTGHNIPESKGGTTTLDNLRPICASCNLSMGRKSIDTWNDYGLSILQPKTKTIIPLTSELNTLIDQFIFKK